MGLVHDLDALPRHVAEKIDVNGPTPASHVYLGPCWLWTAAIGAGGYGLLTLEQTPWRAHCLVYEVLAGPVPDGLELDHLCEVKPCVRPSHLQPVTHQENIRRHYARQATCKHGHPWTVESTHIRPDTGRRECRVCAAQRHRRRTVA